MRENESTDVKDSTCNNSSCKDASVEGGESMRSNGILSRKVDRMRRMDSSSLKQEKIHVGFFLVASCFFIVHIIGIASTPPSELDLFNTIACVILTFMVGFLLFDSLSTLWAIRKANVGSRNEGD